MKTSEFLKRAWGKIDRREKWVTNNYQLGTRYCMVGAMDAIRYEAFRELEATGENTSEAYQKINLVYEEVRARLMHNLGSHIEAYNDSHTWEQLRNHVLAELELIEGEEQPEITVEVQPQPAFLKQQEPRVVRVQATQQVKQAEKELA